MLQDAADKHVARPFALEVFAGSARLTAALIEVGFEACGVDWEGNKDKPVAPVRMINLACLAGQAELDELLEHPLLAYAHFAPPCGTASRARERKIAGIRGGGPPPLRSTLHPEGLPDLEVNLPRASRKVQAANVIYEFVARACAKLVVRGVPWSLENPHDSLFWYLKYVIALLGGEVGDVFFHHCMHGGDRDKRTRLRCFPRASFQALAVDCDRRHAHKPWGLDKVTGEFATASERVYPWLLCQRLAAVARAVAEARGAGFPAQPQGNADADVVMLERKYQTRASTGIQPRGNKFPHVVPLFKRQSLFDITLADVEATKNLMGTVLRAPLALQHFTLEEGTKLVQVTECEGSPGPDPAVTPSRFPFDEWERLGFPPGGFLYVGRGYRNRQGTRLAGSPWANPFKLRDHSRDIALQKFRAYLPSLPFFPDGLKELSGAKLVCHCRRDQACHADVLIEQFDQHVRKNEATGRHATLNAKLPWSTSEFVEQARSVEHPFAAIVCEQAIWKSAFLLATRGPAAFGDMRLRALANWRVRARELEPDEARLHASLHPDVRGSVGRKRLLLLKEMLAAAGFPCAELVFSSMVGGFTVLGKVPATGVFPPKEGAAAAMQEEDLKRQAVPARRTLLAAHPPNEDRELLAKVYQETRDEVARGWLRGPFTADELDVRHSWWLPARRFGIRQGDKVRAVDDYSLNGHNECTETSEKIDVGGIDNVLAIVRCLMKVLGEKGDKVEVQLPDGEGLLGERAPDLGPCELKGGLWDLVKAYRQLPRDPSQAHLSIVAVFNPSSGSWEFYEQLALPFGATAAVYHFNLVARGFQVILSRLFAVFCSHFFDDYPVVEHALVAKNTRFILDSFFDLLGWDTKGESRFESVFEPLGVVVDLSKAAEDKVTVTNKPRRVAELKDFHDSIAANAEVSAHEVRQLCGRFVFARSQVFGRCGAPLLRLLSGFADARGVGRPGAKLVASALRRLIAILVDSPPRAVAASLPPPCVLFVDGACEPGARLPEVGVGACLFGCVGGRSEFFGGPVGGAVVRLWAARPDQQVIAQAELVPVLLALSAWAPVLRGRPLVVFIDNDAARFGLVAGYSPVVSSAAIISAVWGELGRLGIPCWFARVPTVCNPADGPSRLRFDWLTQFGSTRMEPTFKGLQGGRLWDAVAECLRGEVNVE